MLPNERSEQFRSFMDEYSGVEGQIQELINERRDLRKKIRDSGLNMKAFDAIRSLLDDSDDRIAQFWHDLSSGLVWMQKPIGYQPDLYEAEVSTISDPALTEDQQRAVIAAGRAGGLRGAAREANEWTPGSLAHALWDEGFLAGAKELETRMNGEDDEPPPVLAATRSRGRPRGAVDSKPRAPRGSRKLAAPEEPAIH